MDRGEMVYWGVSKVPSRSVTIRRGSRFDLWNVNNAMRSLVPEGPDQCEW
jgi:hypothetical protein